MWSAGEGPTVDSKQAIATFTGECGAMDPTVGTVFAPDEAQPWTLDEVAAFLDTYYSCTGAVDIAKCITGRPFKFHIGSTPAELCWKLPQNPDANRVLADRIGATCKKKVLTSDDGKKKCAVLEAYAELHASTPSFFSGDGLVHYLGNAGKYLLVGIPGAILAGWGFHVGYGIHQEGSAGTPHVPQAVADAGRLLRSGAPAARSVVDSARAVWASAAAAAASVAGGLKAGGAAVAVWLTPPAASAGAFAGTIAAGAAIGVGLGCLIDWSVGAISDGRTLSDRLSGDASVPSARAGFRLIRE